jgi:dCMP deaminase
MAKSGRAGWDEYFMRIALDVSGRSTCDRKHVGAVIVRDRNILSTGYNGSIAGMPHCDDVGHMMEGGHCIATIHAEANAIIQAAKNGVNINGAFLYTTASPCWNCFKLVVNAGMRRILFGEFYRDDRIFVVAEKLSIDLVDLSSVLAGIRKEAGEPGRIVGGEGRVVGEPG